MLTRALPPPTLLAEYDAPFMTALFLLSEPSRSRAIAGADRTARMATRPFNPTPFIRVLLFRRTPAALLTMHLSYPACLRGCTGAVGSVRRREPGTLSLKGCEVRVDAYEGKRHQLINWLAVQTCNYSKSVSPLRPPACSRPFRMARRLPASACSIPLKIGRLRAIGALNTSGK